MTTPMQAITYFQTRGGLRFWWIKPDPDGSDDECRLGSKFLRANADGACANLPSAAASGVYQSLVGFFGRGSCDNLQFQLQEVDGCERACITVDEQQLWVYWIWQEEWSSIADW